jgi:hypothetical protein
MISARIKDQYQDEKDLFQYLMEHGEVTFATYIQDVYKKVLLLSAASFFEAKISDILLRFAKTAAKDDFRVVSLIEKKIIERQYHTFFNWDGNNTNTFWSLFGEEFKTSVRKRIDKSDNCKQAELDFLDLGRRRNLLVHKNFSEFDIDITIDDIYRKYESAGVFVELIEKMFISNNEE